MGSAVPGESAGHQADDAQQLREDIERTREHLGAAVEQLAAKVDVKSRARAQAADMVGRMKSAGAKAKGQAVTREEWVLIAVAGAAFAAAALIIWRGRKR
jgi:hypothetical protein